jgi:membrane fusion protein (multidrug efflux system)
MTRYVPVVVGLLAVVGTLGGLKCAQISTIKTAGAKAQKSGPPPEAVNTAIAKEESWDRTLDTVGSVATAEGVSVANEGAGIVARIDFQSGDKAKEGQVLVELDTRVERGQLASAQAKQQLASVNAERTRKLFASGSVAKAQLDADNSALDAANADVKALAAEIQRKVVRAPFAGKLGIRQINVGQYLAAGTPITLIESGETNYVDFSLPQRDLEIVAVGMPVRFQVGGGGDAGAPLSAQGTIFTVDPAIDPTTRNIKLRAHLPPDADWLRPGMFVRVSVIEPTKETVVAIPATAIVHASFGDSVFVVEDEKDEAGNVVKGPDGKPSKVVRQQFVKTGPLRGDFVAVTEGVKAGEEVVTAGGFKLRNRARVVVSTAAELHPELSPHPVNR